MSGNWYRRYRSRPLLTIHFIQAKDPTGKHPERIMPANEIGTAPMVALSLSFPNFDDSGDGEKVVYRLNRVALRDLFGEEEGDADDTD